MKLINQARRYGRQLAAVGAAGAALAFSAASNAAVTIDTTEPLAQVTEGGTAAAAIGLAMIGFVVLVGVLIKTRRAGS